MATNVTVKTADSWPEILVTLTQGGVAIDLNDVSTVKMRMASSAVTVSPITCSTADASNGQVTVPLSAAATATAGTYNVEFELDWGGGDIQTVPNDGYNTVTILDAVAES